MLCSLSSLKQDCRPKTSIVWTVAGCLQYCCTPMLRSNVRSIYHLLAGKHIQNLPPSLQDTRTDCATQAYMTTKASAGCIIAQATPQPCGAEVHRMLRLGKTRRSVTHAHATLFG